MSIDMTLPMWAIFIMGVYGEISHFLSDPTEILFLVIKKNVDTRHESFSSKKKSNKTVIAKKPLTNLYELNSKQPTVWITDHTPHLFGLIWGQTVCTGTS